MPHPRDLGVLVIGEALVDVVETDAGRTEHVGGSPANVALGLGRRGVRVGLLTQLADDARGRMIVDHLEASGVDVLASSISAVPTSTAVARIAADGHAEYDFDLTWNDVAPVVDVTPRLVHTGSVAAFLEPGAGSVRNLLRNSRAQEITFDPNVRPALLGSHDAAFPIFEATARMSTVVKLSDEDAAWLYPGASPDRVLEAVLALGPRLSALTLGDDGAVIANAEYGVWIPATDVEAVDTIGAGDTFMASLIHSVLESGSGDLGRAALERIGRNAVSAAAITVSRAGANLPWAHELTP